MVRRGTKEINPEEVMRRKFRAKCRFRRLVRMVIANLYWLAQDEVPYEGDDVHRRIEQALRAKSKKKQQRGQILLTMDEKALLNKRAKYRTEHEKKYIYRVIGNLKCFKMYPNTVKKQLAAVTYYKYVSPNRVLIREGQEAHALYFVLNGIAKVTKLQYDGVLKTDVPVFLYEAKPGDIIGEVSLLHGIPRSATVTTIEHFECLVLLKKDFKNVLQSTIQRQWDKIRAAMNQFNYFENFSEVTVRQGCVLAKMKSYEPNEIILGDGVDVPNFVYFVLNGRCQMIESLKIETIVSGGRKHFKLHDHFIPQRQNQSEISLRHFENLFEVRNVSQKTKEPSAMPIGSRIIKTPIDRSGANSNIKSENSRAQFIGTEQVRRSQELDTITFEADRMTQATSMRSGSRTLLAVAESKKSSMHSGSLVLTPKPCHDVRFMQVCIYNKGSTFSLGENMRDRRIIALTKVDVMLLPRVWLLQNNAANIWTRILYFLQKKLPTKQKLFESFVLEQRWKEFRDTKIGDVLRRMNREASNHTSIHDVPYTIRLQEIIDNNFLRETV